jgi:superfamily II DNA or RNA helicase
VNLRPYQSRAVDFLQSRIGIGARGLVVCPAGGGKTIIGAAALALVSQPWDRIGWACNTREQVEQGEAALKAAGVKAAWVKCVAGISREDTAGLDFLVVDECFQSSTLIDGIPISEIKAGDFVWSFNHPRQTQEKKKVLGTFKRTYNGTFIRFNSSSGAQFACTEGHPIYVSEYGYIPAGRIAELLRMRLRNTAEAEQAQEAPIQVLREQVRHEAQRKNQASSTGFAHLLLLREAGQLRKKECTHGSNANWTPVLLSRLLKGIRQEVVVGDDAKNQSRQIGVASYENDAGESDAESSDGKEGATRSCRADISIEGRQWEDNKTATETTRSHRAPDGIRNTHTGRNGSVFAEPLQGGLGGAEREAFGGSGRQDTPYQKVEILRREEDGSLSVDWLESCEVYKCGSGPRPDWLRGEDTVYNLHVEGNENYFADGVLVHNCHHLPSASWSLIADACTGTIWGLTATPKSPDPERNFWFARFWGEGNTITIPRAEVLEGGHLAHGRVVILDLDQQGEFDAMIESAAQLESLKMARRFPMLDKQEIYRRAQWRTTLDLLIENPARNAAVVETALMEIGRGQSVLVLVAEIEQGERFAALIPDSIVAHSKMGAKKRKAAIDAFRDGTLRCLIATSLADEGLDVPRASVLILATAGRSGAKLEQRTGRVMRPHEGKGVGLVYDFADAGASMARSQGLARRRVYKQLGYSIETSALCVAAA